MHVILNSSTNKITKNVQNQFRQISGLQTHTCIWESFDFNAFKSSPTVTCGSFFQTAHWIYYAE